VRFASITAKTLVVTIGHTNSSEPANVPIPGTIQPYPFETEPGVVSRVTFVPDDPEALRRDDGPPGAFVYTIRARGTGDNPIVDLDGRPLDGAGTDKASDFVSRFFTETAPQ
jgi:hypothetical protein